MMAKILFHALAAIFYVSLISCASKSSNVMNAEYSIGRIFSANDADRNGCLSAAEWREMSDIAARRLQQENVQNLDQLTMAYLRAFTDIDYDGDGCITREEY